MSYINDLLFRDLEKATIQCGGNIAGIIYINYFRDKSSMSTEDFERFKRDVNQEIQVYNNLRFDNRSPSQKLAIENLRNLL